MKEITLSNGLKAIVDDEDYAQLRGFNWSFLRAPRTFYATRRSMAVLLGKPESSHETVWLGVEW